MSPEDQPEGILNQHLEAALVLPVIQTTGVNLRGYDNAQERLSEIDNDFVLIESITLRDPRLVEAIGILRSSRDSAISAIARLHLAQDRYYEARLIAKGAAAEQVETMHQELSELDK